MHAEVVFKAPGSSAWQELAYPLEAVLVWLFAHGVAPEAMAEPWPLRSARVVFDDLYGFDFRRHGESAIIFKAEDRGDELDLIAWEARTGKLASWHGNIFCLGDLEQKTTPRPISWAGHFAFMPRRLSG